MAVGGATVAVGGTAVVGTAVAVTGTVVAVAGRRVGRVPSYESPSSRRTVGVTVAGAGVGVSTMSSDSRSPSDESVYSAVIVGSTVGVHVAVIVSVGDAVTDGDGVRVAVTCCVADFFVGIGVSGVTVDVRVDVGEAVDGPTHPAIPD